MPKGRGIPPRALPLKNHLVLSYLAVILIGIGIVAPLAWLTVERLYLRSQEANLLAQAKLIAAALGVNSLQPADPAPYSYTQLSNTRPGVHTRVIDSQGAVVIRLSEPEQLTSPAGLILPQLAQNAAGTVTPEELLSRAEIEQALQGYATTAIRRVDVAGGQPVLYAAAPVLSTEGSVLEIVYLATPLPDTQWAALPIGVRWQLIGSVIMAVLIASGAGLFLAGRIAHPLRNLADATQAIARGNLDEEVPEDPSISELSILSQSFNNMTGALRNARKVKDAFLANVTHELRTPLTVIKGTIETLQDGALDDLAAREPFLEAMNQETDRLIRMVNDLLVLTRADSDALNLQFSPVDLEDLARQRCDTMRPYASQRQVQLIVDAPPQRAGQPFEPNGSLVLADSDRIAQVLDNLLDNAIRFSNAGNQVRVRIDPESDQVRCQVIDSGPGIPARHLPYIFERFYRADPARERSQGGSGLGLSIVHDLVKIHGGGVSVTSAEGQGTTVSFWLPAVKLTQS